MHLKRIVREKIVENVNGKIESFCCKELEDHISACAGIREFHEDGYSFNSGRVFRYCQFCGAKVRVDTERILPKGYFRKLGG